MKLLCLLHEWEGAYIEKRDTDTRTDITVEVWHCVKCGRRRAWWSEKRYRSDGPPRPEHTLRPSYEHYQIDWRIP